MAATLALRCTCGHLRGALHTSPAWAARGVCYCDDCQVYARFLAPAEVTNERGGTEVLQSWPSSLTLTEGTDALRLVRLSSKGLHRFYAGCCRAPVGNTLGPKWPFVGVMASFIEPEQRGQLDALFGPAYGVQGRFALGGCPPGVHPSATIPIIARAAWLMLRGWAQGARRPTPLFNDDGTPVCEAQILSVDERASLASALGATPSASTPRTTDA